MKQLDLFTGFDAKDVSESKHIMGRCLECGEYTKIRIDSLTQVGPDAIHDQEGYCDDCEYELTHLDDYYDDDKVYDDEA